MAQIDASWLTDIGLGLSKGLAYKWRGWRPSIQATGWKSDCPPRQRRPRFPSHQLARFRFIFQGFGVSFARVEQITI